MISKHNKKYISNNDLGLKCFECGSLDFGETNLGNVCKSCGIVLKTKKLVYNKPYREEQIQYEKLNDFTQIGNKTERKNLKESYKYHKFDRLQSLKTNEKNMKNNAIIEINRIFMAINLPKSYKEIVIKKYEEMRKHLKPKSKYRNPEKLVPIVIYLCMKAYNISINQKELLQISNINKKDFNAFKLIYIECFPDYHKRNKKKYVLQKIIEVSENFDLGMEFVNTSQDILNKLWDMLKLSKDEIIAGLISSIVILCKYKNIISINKICTYLDIKMSSIQNLIKKKIFNNFNINGFTSLVKSSELMKQKFVNMGWIVQNKDFNKQIPI